MKTSGSLARAAAFLIDALLILSWAVVLAVISIFFLPRGLGLFATPLISDMEAFLLLVLPAILYFSEFEVISLVPYDGFARLFS